jgi:recombination protein RecT
MSEQTKPAPKVHPNQLARQNVERLLTESKDTLLKVAIGLDDAGIDRLIKQAALACFRNPRLLQCEPGTIVNSVLQIAELGLDFTPARGHAYIVPFKNNDEMVATPMVGYRGLIALAGRDAGINVAAFVVYEHDEFWYQLGTDPKIHHVPPKTDADRGLIVAAYAVATFPDGRKQFDVMDRNELQAIRARSPSVRAKQFSPWDSDLAEMCKKTPVRRLSKYLPDCGDKFYSALQMDDDAEAVVAESAAAIRGEVAAAGAAIRTLDAPPENGQHEFADPEFVGEIVGEMEKAAAKSEAK